MSDFIRPVLVRIGSLNLKEFEPVFPCLTAIRGISAQQSDPRSQHRVCQYLA